ncbi:SDR family NAD(P)-dependent oxidoreductase [Rapidithrix thailandica]|uniref:SDR family NAD(P)-dependent oxidoreductase n=1 Tax=Rapidithrix thailandica TaxID=413964 RepID=A0AAW9S047_9BACT
MIFQKNTVLITGGSSGIGLELAKRLIQKDNQVIICGRSQEKLQKAKQQVPKVKTFQCDVSQKEDCIKLVDWIQANYPNCNVLINNAAIVHVTDFCQDDQILEKTELEIRTNLMGPIVLSKLMMPLLKKNAGAKLINITSGLAYTPKAAYPIYNATKAALHSFTQVLRKQMHNSPVSVIEVLFPAVDTPWHKGNPPGFAIPPEEAVQEMLQKLEKGALEIKVGKVKMLYQLNRLSPSIASKLINK